MIDHDRLFKELLTTFFFDFIELFLPRVAEYLDRSHLEFLDKEVFTDVTAGERTRRIWSRRCGSAGVMRSS